MDVINSNNTGLCKVKKSDDLLPATQIPLCPQLVVTVGNNLLRSFPMHVTHTHTHTHTHMHINIFMCLCFFNK